MFDIRFIVVMDLRGFCQNPNLEPYNLYSVYFSILFTVERNFKVSATCFVFS